MTNITFSLTVTADNGKKITTGNYIVKIIFNKVTLKTIFDENMLPKVPLPLVGIPLTKALSDALIPKIPKKLIDLIVVAGHQEDFITPLAKIDD